MMDVGNPPSKAITPTDEFAGLENLDLHSDATVKDIDPKELLSEDLYGNLVLVSEIDDIDENDTPAIGLESLIGDTNADHRIVPHVSGIIDLPHDKISGVKFGANGSIISLCGYCDLDVDVLTHALLHADESDTFKLVYGKNTLNKFEIAELAEVIKLSKARVELFIAYMDNIFELLLISPCATSSCQLPIIVTPENVIVSPGSELNVELSLKASVRYMENIYTTLVAENVLSPEDVEKLKGRSPIGISAERLTK